jgi:hypothetical protein
VDCTDDDALIAALIEAATQDAEHLMQRAIMPQQWRLTLDSFAEAARNPNAMVQAGEWRQWVPITPAQPGPTGYILLQRPTVRSVDSIQYVAADTGVLTTLDPSLYQSDLSSEFVGRIAPAYAKTWPAVRNQLAAIVVLFTSGWADAASVPNVIKAWIKLRIGALYEHREAWTTRFPIDPNPHVDYLLDRYRVHTI